MQQTSDFQDESWDIQVDGVEVWTTSNSIIDTYVCVLTCYRLLGML